jgi:DNA-binding MarR family transcriptional regulator
LQLDKAERRFKLATQDYAQLASFRHTLRGFLSFSEAAASQEGLTSQQYQAMLVLRGCPEGQTLTINDLAGHLLIKHNSAVGLVDRLAAEGSAVDRRMVELRLSPRGRQVLARLAAMHRAELRRIGPLVKRFFSELGRREGESRASHHQKSRS